MSAFFSNKNIPDDYNFDSQKKDRDGNELYVIIKDKITHDGKDFYIPKGCVLSDPDSLKDRFGN